MISSTDNPSDWETLRSQSLSLFGLASLRPEEVEGHYSADLGTEDSQLLTRFAKADRLTDEERQNLITLLRQNRTAMESLKGLIDGSGVAEAE